RAAFVPVPFDENMEVEWSPVWSLNQREFRYLATELCYYCDPFAERNRSCIADSNGNAAGNTLEEAILQGFFELVERDSVGLWWDNRGRGRAGDLSSLDEPYLHQVSAYLHGRHRELWILDLTTDLRIPAFAAISRRRDLAPERIMLGFGAHL